MLLEDYPALYQRKGERYIREPGILRWRNDDPQAFTPLRFLPPQLMGYQGRALVMDPDIFAVSDINELLMRDMEGKAIFCRKIDYSNTKKPNRRCSSSSSV